MPPPSGRTPVKASPSGATKRAFSLFWLSVRRRPFATILGLPVEYLTYFAAVSFALLLLVTRVPMRALDRVTGLRLRERFIELIARISPG